MSLLEFRGVSRSDGRNPPVRGLSLALSAGDRVVAFGPSGSGKRTFLKLAAGILEPETGSVTAAPASGRGLSLGFMPLEGGLISNLTLLENALLPVLYHELEKKTAAEARAKALFAELGLTPRADIRPSMVSASSRRLAQLARALLVEPSVFVLDEPLAEVEASAARTIRGFLAKMGTKDNCAVVGTAVLAPYLDWGRRFLFFREGSIVAFEGAEAVRRCRDEDVRACLE